MVPTLSGVVIGSDGVLYGTTAEGGMGSCELLLFHAWRFVYRLNFNRVARSLTLHWAKAGPKDRLI